jgi:hypothetical protein
MTTSIAVLASQDPGRRSMLRSVVKRLGRAGLPRTPMSGALARTRPGVA